MNMALLGTVKAVTGTAFIGDDRGVKRPVNLCDVVQIGPNQLVTFTEDLGRVLVFAPSEDPFNLFTMQNVIKAIESGRDVNDAIEEACAGSISYDREGNSFVTQQVMDIISQLQTLIPLSAMSSTVVLS
jgi:hypothetical protein